ncbi:uncharacterized protein LOC119083410 [Bradysia coprophila]|uniref:uncharacterized protein LOC119083410 n=1 Tax=Bradysia coprophila TaxID=38358 RepID=UPI00187D7C55|nr:uncharacterized protein LOC119083410 [Bradysia coprophila]
MLSRLIEESKRTTLLVIKLDSEILDYFVRSHNLQLTVIVHDLKTPLNLEERKIDVSILHCGSFVEFEKFFVQIQPELFLYDGHFIIIYDVIDAQELESVFSTFWKAYIYNVNVLVASPNSSNLVSLFTYKPFSNGSCNNTNPIRVNQFDKTIMNWTTNEFFPKKFKQLNRCPLRFGCYENSPGVLVNNSESGLNRFTGMNIDFCVMFSGILNFTLNIFEYEKATGVIYPNKTATAMLKRVIENEIDFIFGSLQRTRVEAMSATRIVHSDKLILVVPPPFLIDPMTKIFLPFTFASWISIGAVALLACSIVKLLEFTPKVVHDYVIGSNVKGSVLNVFNVFLGGTQKILPRSNFPRFLLAKFLIFTLIMRSLYQGEVFDILKRDVRTVELTTIDEFIEHKFTFYIYQSLAMRLEGSKIMQRFDENLHIKST